MPLSKLRGVFSRTHRPDLVALLETYSRTTQRLVERWPDQALYTELGAQLDAIRERRGLVGVNYATAMLRPDGRSDADTPLSDMIRHIDYLVNRIGVDCVALGSDFDGATIPEEIGDAAGNQKLIAALRQAGYGDEELRKMASENWLRILASAWREEDV